MSRDLAIYASLALLVGVAVTAHITTIVGLASQKPRWPALVAFFVPPTSPFLAARAGMWVRAAFGFIGLVGYAIVRIAFPG